MENSRFEQLRSGFLKDGRFYSIEATPRGLAGWEARIVCVPGGHERTIQVAADKHRLRLWAERLSPQQIEVLAKPLG
jgi:hypothetical protein